MPITARADFLCDAVLELKCLFDDPDVFGMRALFLGILNLRSKFIKPAQVLHISIVVLRSCNLRKLQDEMVGDGLYECSGVNASRLWRRWF